MKTIILTIISGFLLTAIYAQPKQSDTLIKGIVMDSLKKQGLGYVTVVLTDQKTSLPIKSVLTTENGGFEFTHLPKKNYTLSVAMTGYENKTVFLPEFSSSESLVIDAGNIYISTAINILKEVVVTNTGIKPIIKQEVDRISYDVQADPENAATNVLDMLRKVPLVSVDATDNIKLKGTGNFKILINGKPSALIARNPSDIFKSMPASNIQKIEVITTPPAKYDAEGLAGIINIITKKNTDQGYNGSINTYYSNIYGPGLNLNATLKQGKFGLNGYIGHNDQKSQTTKSGYSNQILNPVLLNLTQENTNIYKGKNDYGSAELSFEMDSLDLLTGSIEFYDGKSPRNSNQFSALLDANGQIQQSYRLTSQGTSDYKGMDLSLNYQLGFKKNKDQLLTTSYKYSIQKNLQHTDAAFTDKINYAFPDYRQNNNSGTREHTTQLDYIKPFKTLTIEAGAKAIIRNNYSNFGTDNLDSISGQYLPNTDQTNDFTYRQNVYGAYNSYQLKLKKMVVKGGLRLEHTNVQADFTSTNSNVQQDYNNLIPSFSIQQTLKGNNSINLGYTDRIQRPGIWLLNPFIDKSNPLVISVGNPALQPVVRHSLEFSYSNFTKGSITAGLAYTIANNTIENVTSVAADTITTSTYKNIGRNRGLGLTLNANYTIFKKLNLNVNSQLLHVWLSGTYNGQFYDNKGFQGHIFVTSGYTFDKGYHAGFDIGYDSRYVLLQGKDNEYFYVSFSGSKELFKKKATIALYISNPFNQYKRIDFYTNTNDFHQYNYNEMYARRINISFKYKFGKLNSSIKKNQRSISNDDSAGRSGH